MAITKMVFAGNQHIILDIVITTSWMVKAILEVSLVANFLILVCDSFNLCIDGSRGGGASPVCAPPPQWDPILSFLHTFSLKSTHVKGQHPPTAQCPQWEILDLPLL